MPQSLLDPHLLDSGVVEVLLQRPETGYRVEHGSSDEPCVDQLGQSPADAALVVVSDHFLHQPAHRGRVGSRVEATAPDQLPHLVLDDGDRLHAGSPGLRRSRGGCGDRNHPQRSRGQIWRACG